MRSLHHRLCEAHFRFALMSKPARPSHRSVSGAARAFSRRGRPALLGVPSWLRDFHAWGGSKRVAVVGVRQLEFPLECVMPIKVGPQFPDPLRQGCFQVRHD